MKNFRRGKKKQTIEDNNKTQSSSLDLNESYFLGPKRLRTPSVLSIIKHLSLAIFLALYDYEEKIQKQFQ